MSRRAVVAVLVGAVLTGGLAAPALADPVSSEGESLCVRVDGRDEDRKGVCVWVPDPR